MVADLTRKLLGVRDNQLCPELSHYDIGVCGAALVPMKGARLPASWRSIRWPKPSLMRQSKTCLCLSGSYARWTWRMKRSVRITVLVGGRGI
jgi:hypothetical protein